METKNAYIHRKDAQLASWQGTVQELAQEAEDAGGWAKRALQFEVDALKARCTIAQEILDELKALGNDRRDALTDGLDCAWGELRASFKDRTYGT